MGLKANFIIEILKNRIVNLFQTSSGYFYDHSGQFALLVIPFGHVGTATLKQLIKQKQGCARFTKILLSATPWGVLVLLKFQVNSQKLGVQTPQNFEFE